jgi:hypothetical protein
MGFIPIVGGRLVFPTFQCQPNAGQQFLLGDRFAEEAYCAGAQCLRAGAVIGKGSNYNNGDAITRSGQTVLKFEPGHTTQFDVRDQALRVPQ